MLENTLYKLRNMPDFTVAYFGGSITEGAGASSYENCWAAKTTAWLREQFPKCRIRHIQAAIGGTDSTLGAFRCERDVCAHKPDLVFFEFSVNDSALDFETALKNAEACFLKLWKSDPTTDIVTVYTITKTLSDRMAQGAIWSAKVAHGAVSEYYAVPQIDIGEVLRCRVLTEGSADESDGNWLKYTTDTCHPNDVGYELYAEAVQEHLSRWLSGVDTPAVLTPVALPKPIVSEESSHLRAHMVDCREAVTDDAWTLKEESLCRRYPRYIECTEPGGSLTFHFHGSRIDLYWMMASDSGDALCSIDGNEEVLISSWDSYCTRFNRANAACVAKGLDEKEHTLRLRLANSHASGSTGTALRIGAFLVL